jgi:hypothetical protein
MTSSEPLRLAYPHQRNDCDVCREFDADMVASAVYPPGQMEMSSRPQRLCSRCAGAVLAMQVLYGGRVTVTAVAGEAGGPVTQ